MPRRTGLGTRPLLATARAAASGNTAGSAVFANELPYDNTGSDTGEAAELAGPLGGPVDGRTSVDIGVAEGSSTPVGRSLQLTGQGSSYEEMTWAAAGRQARLTGRS